LDIIEVAMIDNIIIKILGILSPLAPYIKSFIPIFVAVNAIGTLALYSSLTEGMAYGARKKAVNNSIIAATVIAFLFMVFGKLMLAMTGVQIFDFRIAGGILLLILSVNLLLPGEEKRMQHPTDIGVFPLGTPLITGPAVLATILAITPIYGYFATTVSIILNMAISWIIFFYADFFLNLFGKQGTRALAKVSDMFLAAIAVMLIRSGIIDIINISLMISTKK